MKATMILFCIFVAVHLHAQTDTRYFGKQWIIATSFNGNPGWNDPQGEKFRLLGWNQRVAVGLSKRIFVGVQNRVFWSKAEPRQEVNSWLIGGFVRYYALLPKGEKRRWAFSAELGYYTGNHRVAENSGTDGVIKTPGQSVPNLGFSLERRLYRNLWIELAHNFVVLGDYNLSAYPSLGILWHQGKSNTFIP